MNIDGRNIEPYFHVLFWIIAAVLMYDITATVDFYTMIMHPVRGEEVFVEKVYDENYIFIIVVDIAMKMVMVYGSLYIIFPRLTDRKYFYAILYSIVAFVFTLLVSLYFEHFYSERYIESDVLRKSSRFFRNSIVFHIGAFSLMLAYYFFKNWYSIEKKHQILEKEKLTAELKFLKSQINPHFLFNTLNNIYSIAGKYPNPLLANAVNKLANLMRYMLYETESKEVILSQEIDYLKDYIELQKLRLTEVNKSNIVLVESGNYDNYTISPLILISFVENAFKYSVTSVSNLEINISIQVENDMLIFEVMNSINLVAVQRDSESGIGTKNVIRRLDLIYKDSYSLEIDQEENRYRVKLMLMLHPILSYENEMRIN